MVKVVNSTSDQLATRADFEALQADLNALQAATQADLEALQTATKADLEALQMATKADLEALQTATKADLKAGLLDLQVKFMATQIGVGALIVAVIKLF